MQAVLQGHSPSVVAPASQSGGGVGKVPLLTILGRLY